MPTSLHYLFTVFAWGLTWTAIHVQVGLAAPDISISYRFALSGLVMLIGLGLARRLWRPRRHELKWLALQGLLLYCLNFVFLYRATGLLPSGLVAVIFSLASLFNAANQWWLLRITPPLRLVPAALLGVSGVACMFWPQLHGASASWAGIGFAVLGTWCFSLGNLVGQRNRNAGVPLFGGNAWAMSMGAVGLAFGAWLSGAAFTLPTRIDYWGAMAFLVIVGSILGFASYLTLVHRLGPAKAGFTAVLFPIVALSASTWLEGFVWQPISIIGAIMALAGNLVMFWPMRTVRASTRPSPSVKTD
ncbi:DMT family transporter [Phytohalomonas tamaricis]|uniref:DMT family transporter n=1 Tax=Phytohalomonas tamaricis TaxID=2081032 RepID=UPI000D0B78D0|nr:DMT family transporter [Phytohalomonas tamaricis]